MRLNTESDLVQACPVYGSLANVGKPTQMAALNNALAAELVQHNNAYLHVTLSLTILQNFLSLQWQHLHPDFLTSGFFGDLFLFGSTDEEQQ